MLRAREVADMLNVSTTTIYSWRDMGILVPVYKTPTNRFLYSEEQVQEFIESCNNESATAKGV